MNVLRTADLEECVGGFLRLIRDLDMPVEEEREFLARVLFAGGPALQIAIRVERNKPSSVDRAHRAVNRRNLTRPRPRLKTAVRPQREDGSGTPATAR